MKAITFLFTLLILLTAESTLAFACSCADRSQRQRFREANSIFVGEVIEYKERTVDEPNEDLKQFFYDVAFKIEKQWKGKRQSQIRARATYDSPGMCGDLDLRVGKRILVYASRKYGQLVIYRDCGPNLEADHAKDEIKNLSNFFFRAYTFLYPYPKLWKAVF